jgi:hypothetical protein
LRSDRIYSMSVTELNRPVEIHDPFIPLEIGWAPLSPEMQELLQPATEINYPTVKWINARTFVQQFCERAGQSVTLGQITPEVWQNILKDASAVWMMGMYEVGPEVKADAIREMCLGQYPEWLPDVKIEDVGGSAFALQEYKLNHLVAHDWNESDQVWQIVKKQGKAYCLCFVANHVGLDTPWVRENPNMFLEIPENVAYGDTYNYHPVNINGVTRYFAKARDPNFGPYSDDLQLNYANPEVQEFMIKQLLMVLEHCDMVRVDMATLVNPETFIRTWGGLLTSAEIEYLRNNDFMAKAYRAVEAKFGMGIKTLLAEVYNVYPDLNDIELLFRDGYEPYGKTDIYDRIHKIFNGEMTPSDLYAHIQYLANVRPDYLKKLIGFLGNHDDESLAYLFGTERGIAALGIIGFLPGPFLLKYNESLGYGGRLKARVQLTRDKVESQNLELAGFYERMLALRNSQLVQQAAYSMPERYTAGEFSEKFKLLIPQQYDIPGKGGCISVTNLGWDRADGHIQMPAGAKGFTVFDLKNNRWFRPEEIAHPNADKLYVDIERYGVQAIFYQY